MIEASHFDAMTAYAAAERHQLEDYEPHLYRTRDGGKTWQSITKGLPAGVYVQTVKEDPERRGLLFCGTERAVYVSFDDGDSWQSLQLNLPATSMRDLAIKDDDLIVATHGRGFWVLDDITALRQLDAKTAAADAILFKPAAALRCCPAPSEQGTPLPKDEAQAENPPTGAIIDYYLKARCVCARCRSRSSTAPVTSSAATRATIGCSHAIRTRSPCRRSGRRRRSRCRRRPACTGGCGISARPRRRRPRPRCGRRRWWRRPRPRRRVPHGALHGSAHRRRQDLHAAARGSRGSARRVLVLSGALDLTTPGPIEVPLRSKRQRRAVALQKLNHAVPAFGLLLVGKQALAAGGQGSEFFLGVFEIVSAAALIVLTARELRTAPAARRTPRTPSVTGSTGSTSPLDWSLTAEVLEHWHVTGHIARPTRAHRDRDVRAWLLTRTHPRFRRPAARAAS